MSIDKWVDKDNVVYLCNGVLLSHTKEWNKANFSNMDGSGDDHTLWNKQTEKDNYHMISLVYGVWKNGTNELIYRTEIDTQT